MIRNLPTQAFLLWSASSLLCGAAAIQNLKFTDVVKDVTVLNVTTKKETPAKVGDVLAPPNVVKTGADSRAELVAEDNTVTRVGSNTVFSVEPNSRDVNIGKGSVMFHSPTGKGGGNIKSAGATASVLGTTLIVGANQQGGFKVMLLEGKGSVSGAGGGAVKLNAGQMSFAMPGQAPSQPLNFELKGQVSGSKLVGGFSKPIASIAKIEAAIATQQAQIGSGQLANTGLLIGDSPKEAFKVDSSVIQNVVVLQREKIEKQVLPRSTVLDPRYAVALANGPLNLRGPAPQLEADAEKLAEHGFTLDINARSSGWGQPNTVPGARDKNGMPYEGGVLAFLLARDISLDMQETNPINLPNYLLVTPFEEKNYFGIVSLTDIKVNKSLEIIHPEDQYGKDLLLSAGNTLKLAENVQLKSGDNVPVFNIYTGGYQFSDSLTIDRILQPVSPPAGTPLQVFDLKLDSSDQGGGKRLENPTNDGVLSISAPEIALDRVDLYANGSGGAIRLEAREGLIRIGNAEIANLTTERPLAAGNSASDLDVDPSRPNILSANVYATSKTGITLAGATVETSGFSLKSGGPVEITKSQFSGSSLLLSSTDYSYEGVIESPGSVFITDTTFLDAPTLALKASSSQFRNADFSVHNDLEVKFFDLPLGFPSTTQLAAASFNSIKINSNSPTVRINGTFVVSNSSFELSDVSISSHPPENVDATSPVATSVSIQAQKSSVTLKDSTLDHDLSIDSLEAEVLLHNTRFDDVDSVSIAAENDVTFKDVSVASRTTRVASKVVIASRNGNVTLDGKFSEANAARHATDANGRKIIQARTVSIVSRVALDADGVPTTTTTGSNEQKGNIVVKNHVIRADTVRMSAWNQLELANVDFQKLSATQQVNLAARTTILKDVSFADGSQLFFKVEGLGDKLVAGNFGNRTGVEQGLLNIMSGVTYGTTPIVETGGFDGTHHTAADFQAKLPAAIRDKFNVSKR